MARTNRALSDGTMSVIRDNPEVTASVLADKLGIPVSTVYTARARLRDKGEFTRCKGRGDAWTDQDIQFIRDHPELSIAEISRQLGRPTSSVHRYRKAIEAEVVEVPPVKAPGRYVESLHSWVAEDPELLRIWLKWNGYESATLVKRDKHMECTLLCTAS